MFVNLDNRWLLPVKKIKWVKLRKTWGGMYRIVVKCGWRRFRSNVLYTKTHAVDDLEKILKQINQVSIIENGYKL